MTMRPSARVGKLDCRYTRSPTAAVFVLTLLMSCSGMRVPVAIV